jgi:hypothetical protein
MHVHAALVSLQDGTPPADFDAIVAKLRIVAGEVDGVIDVFAGPNRSDHAGMLTHAIVVLMESDAVLGPWRAHPVHEDATRELRRITAAGAGLDLTRPVA